MAGIKTADPSAVVLDEAFKAAMEGPAKPRQPDAPEEVDRDAPHGRDDDGQPLAPYGWTKPDRDRAARPRLRAGRPSKDDEARTGTIIAAAPSSKKGGGGPAPDLTAGDYSEGLSDLADALWFGLTGLGMLGSKIPVIGKFIPEETIAAEAYVFHAHKDKLCGALSLSAQHNASAARFCAKATQGEVTWVAMAAFMVMPFAVQTAAVLRGGDALARFGAGEHEQPDGTTASVPMNRAILAAMNGAELDAFVAQMEQRARASQAEANASLNGNGASNDHA